jgi:para-nitrobenzyl esterase
MRGLLGGGTPHGLDVVYVFGNIKKVVPPPLAALMHPQNYMLSDRMMRYWTNFAKTSDPNRGLLPEWPRFREGDEETLVFGNLVIRAKLDYLKERLDLLARLSLPD